MITQLRRYTINRGMMDKFLEAWKMGVLPLRTAAGFRIEGAWVVRERNEFVWVMSCDGDDWEARDKAYYASPGRTRLDPDPAQLIARIETWFVTPVVSAPPPPGGKSTA
jgi:hypothetical protein